MKEFKRISVMLIIGLATAVLIYPVLHESGHGLAAYFVGGEIKEINIFPLSNVLCSVEDVTNNGRIIIGISGTLLPIALTSIFNPKKRFILWYANLILRGVCILSLIIAVIAACLYSYGIPLTGEDTTTVLSISNDLTGLIIAGSAVFQAFLIATVAKDRPFKRIGEYLLG